MDDPDDSDVDLDVLYQQYATHIRPLITQTSGQERRAQYPGVDWHVTADSEEAAGDEITKEALRRLDAGEPDAQPPATYSNDTSGNRSLASTRWTANCSCTYATMPGTPRSNERSKKQNAAVPKAGHTPQLITSTRTDDRTITPNAVPLGAPVIVIRSASGSASMQGGPAHEPSPTNKLPRTARVCCARWSGGPWTKPRTTEV